jgi:hypothetical protein
MRKIEHLVNYAQANFECAFLIICNTKESSFLIVLKTAD